jgi:hypothetical protein
MPEHDGIKMKNHFFSKHRSYKERLLQEASRWQYCLSKNLGTEISSSPPVDQVACCHKYSVVLQKVLNVFCVGVVSDN